MDALKREVSEVSGEGDIDMLFLSHLDSDHVNGIDLLLTQCKVVEVVVPYLEDEVFVALLAKDAARGSLTTSFIEMVSDMPGWFGSRGVDRITQVRGDSDDDDRGAPVEPPDGRGGDGEIRPKWTPEGLDSDAGSTHGTQRTAQLSEVVARSTVALATPSGLLNWALIPYVHAPPKRLMAAFRTALEDEFGAPLDRKSIADAARSPAGRDQLRRCYDALWLNHNLVSMTLYAGPVSPHGGGAHLVDRWMHPFGGQGGWLLTGDATFEGARRRQKFTRHYRGVQSLVNVLMTPHHGSIHNFSHLVLNSFPNLIVGYAAAGPNSYGHPHDDVQKAVNSHAGAGFRRVGHVRGTRLHVNVEVR